MAIKIPELPYKPSPSTLDQVVVDDGITTQAIPAPMAVESSKPILQSELADPSFLEASYYLVDTTNQIIDNNGTKLCGGTDTLREVNNNNFGAVQQSLNNEEFFFGQSYDFRPPKMIQNMIDSKITWMRDFFSAKQKGSNYGTIVPFYGGGQELVPAGPELEENVRISRQRIHEWYDMYDRAGLNVTICAHGSPQLNNGQHVPINASFLEFIIDMVQMHPCIKMVELHNEANLSSFWAKTDLQYVEIYRDFARQLREACPYVEIAYSGPSVMWWEDAIEPLSVYFENGMLDYCNAIAVHPYRSAAGQFAPPELEPFYQNPPPSTPSDSPFYENGDGYEIAVKAYHDWISTYKPNMKIYYTEMGYSSGSGGALSVGNEERQAAYASRIFLIDMDLKLRYDSGMTGGVPIEAGCWYQFMNSGTGGSEGRGFGWLYYNHEWKKPIWHVVKSIFSFFSNFDDLTPLDITVTPTDNAAACKFKAWQRTSDDAVIVACWRLDQVASVADDFDTDLSFNPGITVATAKKYQAGINASNPETVSFAQNVGVVTINAPISWRAHWFELLPT